MMNLNPTSLLTGAEMQINPQSIKIEEGNSWPSSISVLKTRSHARLVQTDLTDAELAQSAFMVIQQSEGLRVFTGILDSDTNWNPIVPILTKASHFDVLMADNATRSSGQIAWLPQFESRLLELRGLATEENIPLYESSFDAARKFVHGLNAAHAPGIFLLGNGNVRLLWENERGEQVGLQFRDNAQVQYVFFRMNEGVLGQIMGRESAHGVMDLIGLLGLKHIIAG